MNDFFSHKFYLSTSTFSVSTFGIIKNADQNTDIKARLRSDGGYSIAPGIDLWINGEKESIRGTPGALREIIDGEEQTVSKDRRFEKVNLASKPIKHMLHESQTWVRIGYDLQNNHLMLKFLGIWAHHLPLST